MTINYLSNHPVENRLVEDREGVRGPHSPDQSIAHPVISNAVFKSELEMLIYSCRPQYIGIDNCLQKSPFIIECYFQI